MNSTIKVSVKEGDIIAGRYKVDRPIGVGGFGYVFSGKDKLDKDRDVAIKVERKGLNWFFHEFSQLHMENMILTQLKGGQLNPYSKAAGGFPKVYHFGEINVNETALVMDLLGPSLQSLFRICEYKFSLKSVLIIADQLLYRLQYLHDKGYIHRDLKPDNILMGATPKYIDIVHLIDFGLSMPYWTSRKSKEHIKEMLKKQEVERVGTSRYMSLRCHGMGQVSRRDDMESLAYILAYFLSGSLPWQKVTASTKKQKNDKIAEIKMSMTPEQLFKGAPAAFAEYLKIVRQLKFEEKPNYRGYHAIFREVGKLQGIEYWRGGQFDWTLVDSSSNSSDETKEKSEEKKN